MDIHPLIQRLSFYKFAILELYDTPFLITRWTRMASAFGEAMPNEIRTLLPDTESSASSTTAITVFRHWRPAIRWRLRYPTSPILLIRPLFHFANNNLDWLGLQRTRLSNPHGLFPGTGPGDSLCPLRWGQSSEATLANVHVDYKGHPKMCYLRRQALPRTTLWPDETGTIYNQQLLNQPILPEKPELKVLRARFLQGLTAQIRGFLVPGQVCAVFSDQSDFLEWFRFDCQALYGNRILCQESPFQYIESPGQTQFLMIKDNWIAWNRLPHYLLKALNGCIHLDCDPNRERYREYRLIDSNSEHEGSWLRDQSAEEWAEIKWGNHNYRLERLGKSWHLARSSQRLGSNATVEFYKRFKVYESLKKGANPIF